MDGAPEDGWVLYSSAEPCLMCLGAIVLTPIKTIVWASDAVTGSAYGLLTRTQVEARDKTPLEAERIRALKVIQEPSDAHRSRSRAFLREFFTAQGNVARAQLY